MSAINKKRFTSLAIILCFGFLCFTQTACKNTSQKGAEFTLALEEDKVSRAPTNNLFKVTITSDQEINLADFKVTGSVETQGKGESLKVEKKKANDKSSFNVLKAEEGLSDFDVKISSDSKEATFRLKYEPKKDTAAGTKYKLTVTVTHKDGTPQKQEIEFEKKQKNKKKQKKK